MFQDVPRRFQLILGPRRVGKTTTMYQSVRHLLNEGIPAKRIYWLRLDHPLLMTMTLGQLVEFLRDISTRYGHKPTTKAPLFLFLDELTYAPKWDLWLKTFYDEAYPVRIVGSSSSTAALRSRKLESGVGRWEEQYLTPYLFPEYLDLIGKPVSVPVGEHLHETLENCIKAKIDTSELSSARRTYLLTGGFPELLLNTSNAQQDETSVFLRSQLILRTDAVERAIYKDIPQAVGVEQPMLLERLLYTLAGQITGLLSPANISHNLDGLSQPTFDRYLSYLERSYLVFTLPNYSGSEISVQKRGRKLYFVDGAIRNASLQRGLAFLEHSDEVGLLTENLIASHLHALSLQSNVRLYHWKDKNDDIDLIYDHPQFPLGFEITIKTSHHLRGVTTFRERFSRFEKNCYLVSENSHAKLPSETDDGIGRIPIDLLLLAAGAQAERDLERRLSI
ncbi:MAG: ATP-binding protein [Planctomycetota bacterium]|nr:ATP-binding protein [Planctomycetota bacterium]MDA1213460.1 ATP-binding protein [Planctomycetota bacterium]